MTGDLGGESEALRALLAGGFADWVVQIARYVELGDAGRTDSLAAMVLTTVGGENSRARVERSSRPFPEAEAWLAELVEPDGASRSRTVGSSPAR